MGDQMGSHKPSPHRAGPFCLRGRARAARRRSSATRSPAAEKNQRRGRSIFRAGPNRLSLSEPRQALALAPNR